MNPLGLPPRTMPYLNTFRILNLVWKRRSISRIEVADALGLTKSTVTKIVTQLMADGLVTEGPLARSEGRGRPRVALSLRKDRGLILGVEIRTDGWTAVFADFDGTVVQREAGFQTWNPQHLITDWGDLLEDLLSRGPQVIPVVGVGLALPGIVDLQARVLLRSNPLDLQNPLEVGGPLETRLGVPVSLENDACCGCWGEIAFRPLPVPGPFLFVLCEDRRHRMSPSGPRVAAIGLGLVLGGSPWRGPDHSAGEFSSVFKRPQAEPSAQFDLPAQDLGRAFQDPRVHQALAEELGKNVAMLVNVLNLKTVFVAWPPQGDVASVLETFENLIAANWLYPTPVDCLVTKPTGGADAVAWGAAGLATEVLWGGGEVQPRWK